MIALDGTGLVHIVTSMAILLLALDHLVTGGIGFFNPNLSIALSRKFFGVTIQNTQTYFILIRPWSALGIFAGLVGLLPLVDNDRFKPILYLLALLLLFRIYYRFLVGKLAQREFFLSPTRNLVHIALITLCLCAIIVRILI